MRRERRLKIHTILKNKINCHTLHTFQINCHTLHWHCEYTERKKHQQFWWSKHINTPLPIALALALALRRRIWRVRGEESGGRLGRTSVQRELFRPPTIPSSPPLPCPLSQHTDVHRDNAIEAFSQVARVTLEDQEMLWSGGCWVTYLNSVKSSLEVTPLEKGVIKHNNHTERYLLSYVDPEVRFVTAVTAGDSVKFMPAV